MVIVKFSKHSLFDKLVKSLNANYVQPFQIVRSYRSNFILSEQQDPLLRVSYRIGDLSAIVE
jgi:hypothetical protein